MTSPPPIKVVAVLAAVACAGGVRVSPDRNRLPRREELPAPSWRVVARREGKVLLAANRVILRGIRRREDAERPTGTAPTREYPTLVFENGRVRAGPVARASSVVLARGAERDTLGMYSLVFEGRPVLFAQTGEGPTPHESPADAGVYVVERDDNLWLIAPSGVSRLTADTVRGIVHQRLRAQQLEGVRYLFWATQPLWSLDGSAIAYVTNRTWMLDRAGGQEVWLVDVRARREGPLLSERGQSFAPQGWLASELVYIAREPGISAIDARTGARRAIAVGSVVAISPSASRLLYMTSAGDTVRGHIVTEDGVVNVAGLPLGERLNYEGRFSPSGDRVVLGASAMRDSGITRALYVFDVEAKRLTELERWSFRQGTQHPHGVPAWLDDSTLLMTRLDRRTGGESSVLVRLRR